MYSVPPYYMAKILLETPMITLTPLLYTVICYFKIGTTITAGQFFYFYLITLLVAHNSASLGYFFSSIFNHEETAVGLAPIIMMPIILFSGFFSNVSSYPVWISWF